MTSVRTLKNGTRVIRAANTNTPEWKLQAAGVRALRALPDYNRTFTLAGDQNAARRGPVAAVQAKAVGMTPGEHDVRIYMAGGRLGLIELKAGNGRLSLAQRERHALLAGLGFDLQAVIRVSTEAEAAVEFVHVVRGWLAASVPAAAA